MLLIAMVNLQVRSPPPPMGTIYLVAVVLVVVFSVVVGGSSLAPPPSEMVAQPDMEEDDYSIWNPTPYFGGGWGGAPIPHARAA